jgi:UDP:flavonoid glycosyltransferase YjiC (YdhE family)
MPFCWDGHDNARRAQDAGVGRALDRYRWSDGELAASITGLLDNPALHDTLATNAHAMKEAAGVTVAAKAILDLI